jgi:hypothetical protein
MRHAIVSGYDPLGRRIQPAQFYALTLCDEVVTDSVNTMYEDTPRVRVKPIVLVVLRRGSKAKERKRGLGPKALMYGGSGQK